VSVWRGDLSRAAVAAEGLLEAVVSSGEPQMVVAGHDALAHLAVARGELSVAADFLGGVVAAVERQSSWNLPRYVPELARLAVSIGELELAGRLGAAIASLSTPLANVSRVVVETELAEARGELLRAAGLYAEAEEGWRTFSVPERAQALLGLGRCLLELGDVTAADRLREARGVFASLDARHFLPEVDALLERAVRRSA
jgi:hypothetical protein